MTGGVKKIWLLLYAEGGRWNAAEIRERLRLRGEIHTALREMVDRGFLVRDRTCNLDGECSIKYWVTKKCKVPRGVAIEEIEFTLTLGMQLKAA